MSKFPETKGQIVKSYELIAEFHLDRHLHPTNDVRRKYYRVDYINQTSLIFMTTNECDEFYNEQYLDEDFECFTEMDQVFKSFNIAIDLQLFLPKKNRYRGVPNFIYYDIVSIKDAVYLRFKSELISRMEGFQPSDFDIYEIHRIEKWLSKSFEKE